MTFEEKLVAAVGRLTALRDRHRALQRERSVLLRQLDAPLAGSRAQLTAALKAQAILVGRVRSTTAQERTELEAQLDILLKENP